MTIRYLDGDAVPERQPGEVLVHNRVRRTAATRSGTRGFRAWLQPKTDRLVICNCGCGPTWASTIE